MPSFDELFKEPGKPIIYNDKEVYRAERIYGPKKFIMKITVVSTNSKLRQGIGLYTFEMKGSLTYNGETRTNGIFGFWEEEIDPYIIMEADIKEGCLAIWNFCDFMGNGSRISATAGCALMIEEMGENKKRYHCNDVELDDDFDDIVFDVEFISEAEAAILKANMTPGVYSERYLEKEEEVRQEQMKRAQQLKEYIQNQETLKKSKKKGKPVMALEQKERELPKFKYHANPLENNIIVKRTAVCPVCDKETAYVYEGPFYTTEEVEGICPWCIADGSAAEKFDGSFQDEANCESVDNDAYIDELIHRTPGYCGWQQEVWLSHCGDFCTFIGNVGWKEIIDSGLETELKDDLEKLKKSFGQSQFDIATHLEKGGSPQGYLFRCTVCGKYRLTVDAD